MFQKIRRNEIFGDGLRCVIAISFIWYFSSVLYGCYAGSSPARTPAPVESAPPPTPPPKPKSSAHPVKEQMEAPSPRPLKITCRAFLLKGQTESPGYGLYSYFLFSRRANRNSDLEERWLAFYQAYVVSFDKYPESREKELKLRKADVNISYWLLDVAPHSKLPDEKRKEKRHFFVREYDYMRADTILHKKIQGIKHRGPFIVSCHHPLTTLETIPKKKEMLIIDLSRIDQSLFMDVADYFRNKVTEDPKTWKERFDLDLIRIHFYSALTIHARPALYVAERVGKVFKVEEAFASP